jgi:tetratricopeptide (TPR) repeat protein
VTAVYIVLLYSGIRSDEEEKTTGSRGIERQRVWVASGKVALAIWGVLVIGAAAVAYQGIRSWKANEEVGVADYLIRQADSKDYTRAQKRTFADEALNRLQKAEALSSHFYEIFNLKGSVLMTLGRYEQAVESYLRAVPYIPGPELYTNLAAAYLALGKRAQAKECIDLALKYDPHYRKARRARRFLRGRR